MGMAKVGLYSAMKRAKLEGKDLGPLLAEGETYKFASAKTKKKWARLAKKS